jgi:hypothetical protein
MDNTNIKMCMNIAVVLSWCAVAYVAVDLPFVRISSLCLQYRAV